MATMEVSEPLKGKISRVSCLLDDASKRLQEEASKCGIFATKTSAAPMHHNNGDSDLPRDLMRTISDIGTLKSVLSCPIFNRIVNVSDSLDKLSYQLNLHPSIGPADISIDPNSGELILAPPIEPPALLNGKLEGFTTESSHQNVFGRIQGPASPDSHAPAQQQQQPPQAQPQPQQASHQGHTNNIKYASVQATSECGNGFVAQASLINQSSSTSYVAKKTFDPHAQSITEVPNLVPSPGIISSLKAHDTEKLVSNGNAKVYVNGSATKRFEDAKTAAESAADTDRRLYKSNGQYSLDQASDENRAATSPHLQSAQSIDAQSSSLRRTNMKKNDYSRAPCNNLTGATNSPVSPEAESLEHHQRSGQPDSARNRESLNKNGQGHNEASAAKAQYLQTASGLIQSARGSCSPSTSAGSTVRLADECDSGASSYQSQTAGKAPYQSYSYKSSEMAADQSARACSTDGGVDSMEHELIENFSPDMERIKVTLEKDSNGLGITIAGYTLENEEISGIFIKSITPGSPADRSGQIRVLDQIYAVNGRELLGYSNPEATNVVRNTGNVVTLELMRYLAESKFRKLQSALAKAKTALAANFDAKSLQDVANQRALTNIVVSPTKNSSIPVSRSRVCGQTTTKVPRDELSSSQDLDLQEQRNGAFAKQMSVEKSCIMNQVPVAAQRGTANKVIETKQGSRNTIDIKSPACQVTTATYVNKMPEIDIETMRANRLRRENFEESGLLAKSQPEWEKDARIIEIYKDSSSPGLGINVREFANPKDQDQPIIMITSITPGGIAERDGRLSIGDLLIFVDDTSLEGANLAETVKALKRANGNVRLGVLKLKREYKSAT